MPRGVYEHPVGSGIWWINYYVDGKRHREKVGRKSDANKLYVSRKADALAGRKLPELRDSKTLHFSELIDDALEYVADHKDRRSYISKAEIVRKAIGSRPAAEITPQELERWLRSHCKTAATTNRYKAFISLCYREGLHNGKVTVNPARQVRHRRESVGRLRFLSREEYETLHKAIKKRFPEHVAEFEVSVNTGDEALRAILAYLGADTSRTSHRRFDENKERLCPNSPPERGCRCGAQDIAKEEIEADGHGLPTPRTSVRYKVLVRAMLGRREHHKLRLALESPYVLFVACDGGSFDQRNSRACRSQNYHDVRAIQPPVARA